MYHIINWDTDEIINSVEKLSVAKRICRTQGHTGIHNGAYYAPVARVQDANGNCVYNPVFKLGRHDNLKAETFVVATNDGDEWRKLDTRGSLRAAVVLAKNTIAPLVAVFNTSAWERDDPKPRFLRDNRDKSRWPIRSGSGVINSAPSSYF